ncbi:MAG: hypothetical protein U9Q81_16415 [Pseudomonadota bacterium]|nr:hypothetical protein [Pseudomonadota bacterium]
MDVHAARILVALLLPLAANAATYKCTQPDGGVTFRQTECARSDAQETVDVDAGPQGSGASSRKNDYYATENRIRQLESERERLETKETREKNSLHRELITIRMRGGSRARAQEIQERLWELDEEYWQRWFENNEFQKEKYSARFETFGEPRFQQKAQEKEGYLCIKYRFRKSELQRGIDSGFIRNDSRSNRLFRQYEIGIRSNCKTN